MKILEFINHASIKTKYNGTICVTDPWYISNAFGSWFQFPSPYKRAVFDLVDTDEKLCVVISHGHDDHLDDWFIKQHFKDKIFFCSKFKSPGLENRLSSDLNVTTKLIGSGQAFGDFEFQQFVNPNYTEYDAVITIQTPEYLIIHANDNWHEWPEIMASKIKKISDEYDEDSVFYLTQFGIADCFPVNYRGFYAIESDEIIRNRFEKYFDATEANMKFLSLDHMYYYANQSLFEYKELPIDGISTYQKAQQFLSDKRATYIQLTPGMSIHKGHKISNNMTGDVTLFRYCLDAFEKFINDRYKKTCNLGAYIAVRFRTFQDTIDEGDINYIATREIWNRILIGELTLEAITIGGSGVIAKPNLNIRDHHHFVSKMAYIAQKMIKAKGLIFYREIASET